MSALVGGQSEIIFEENTGLPVFPGLVGHWQLNEGEGSNIYDSSRYLEYYNGEISGDASWTEGKNLSALNFNGTSNYIEVDIEEGKEFSFDGSLSLWIKGHSEEGGTIIDFEQTGGAGWLTHNANSFTASSGTIFVNGEEESVYEPEEWLHVVVSGITIESGGTDFLIGNGTEGKFNGIMDDIRLFSYPLTEEDAAAFYWSKTDDPLVSLRFARHLSEITVNHQGSINARLQR